MDDRHFDRLTASLSRHLARRRLLGSLLGAGTTALLAWPPTAVAKKKKGCAFGRPRCGDECCTLRETCKRQNGRRRCVHHCEDGRKNLGETDKDCGRICDGALGQSPQGLCRLRKRCERGEDCKSGRCREPRPGEGKQCVECLTDTHCGPSATPRCLDNFCFQCALDRDCPGLAGDPEERFCVALDFTAGPNDAACPPNEPCVCRECRQDADCPEARPHCQTGTGTPGDGQCFECLDDPHCPEGQLCNEQGRCEGFVCTGDEDCPAGEMCVAGSCFPCVAGGESCSSSGECCSRFCCGCLAEGFHCCTIGQRCMGGGDECVVCG